MIVGKKFCCFKKFIFSKAYFCDTKDKTLNLIQFKFIAVKSENQDRKLYNFFRIFSSLHQFTFDYTAVYFFKLNFPPFFVPVILIIARRQKIKKFENENCFLMNEEKKFKLF